MSIPLGLQKTLTYSLVPWHSPPARRRLAGETSPRASGLPGSKTRRAGNTWACGGQVIFLVCLTVIPFPCSDLINPHLARNGWMCLGLSSEFLAGQGCAWSWRPQVMRSRRLRWAFSALDDSAAQRTMAPKEQVTDPKHRLKFLTSHHSISPEQIEADSTCSPVSVRVALSGAETEDATGRVVPGRTVSASLSVFQSFCLSVFKPAC